MSNTRTAKPGTEYRVERYMSDPTLAAGRALPFLVVSAKAELLGDERKRQLLYFLQMRSIEDGGLRKVADEFLEMVKHRFGTASMRKFGCRPGQVYNREQVLAVRTELFPRRLRAPLQPGSAFYSVMTSHKLRLENAPFPLKGEMQLPPTDQFDELRERLRQIRGDHYNCCHVDDYDVIFEEHRVEADQYPDSYPVADFLAACTTTREELERLLMEVCTNPQAILAFHNEPDTAAEAYERRVRMFHDAPEVTEGSGSSFYRVNLPCLPDFLDALVEYRNAWAQATPPGFVETDIARRIFADIDFAKRFGKISLIQVQSGSGKSVAGRAYCRRDAGMSRLVNLKGISHKGGVMVAVAKAFGIGWSGLSSTRLQNKIEDALAKSKLTLVIDEAHQLFSSTERVRTRPELVDWIYSIGPNQRVPVALLATPMFSVRMRRAEHQVESWNSVQFKRRTRALPYPKKPELQDFTIVVARMFPEVSAPRRKRIVGYASMSDGLLGAVESVWENASEVARQGGRDSVTDADVEEALRDYCIPSDLSLMPISTARSAGRPKRGRSPAGSRLAPRRGAADELPDDGGDDDFVTGASRSNDQDVSRPRAGECLVG
jgi:histone H3/H4